MTSCQVSCKLRNAKNHLKKINHFQAKAQWDESEYLLSPNCFITIYSAISSD